MKTVTYRGTADRYRIQDRYLWRGVPTELPNDLADRLAKRGDQFTVHEDQPSNEGTTEGEDNGS